MLGGEIRELLFAFVLLGHGAPGFAIAPPTIPGIFAARAQI